MGPTITNRQALSHTTSAAPKGAPSKREPARRSRRQCSSPTSRKWDGPSVLPPAIQAGQRPNRARMKLSRCSNLRWQGVANGQERRFRHPTAMSVLPPIATKQVTRHASRKGPCVDGSELARRIFTSQAWSAQPCVRPLSAVHMTAGHNAPRGSGPGQKLAFENALARVGCPDRRIDRLCITCCSPSQPSHHAMVLGAISSDPQRDWIIVSSPVAIIAQAIRASDFGRPSRQ
jgi:hypothetical protein